MVQERTTDEVRTDFLKYVWGLIDYWSSESRRPDTKEKLECLAFSILSLIDGGYIGLPKFILAPDPHPDDKDYRISNNEYYYPENYTTNIKSDISGSLHELFDKIKSDKRRI